MDLHLTPDNGSASSVVYNAQQHKFYAAARAHGFYVSSDGMTFTRMGADLRLRSTDRPRLALQIAPLRRRTSALVRSIVARLPLSPVATRCTSGTWIRPATQP